ncbi:MAG: superoxide dismutase family protein, partial [Sphingomonadaceae bacterium]|nr:superoxide dismutase family protein [Sphingomonadaceae bacterium]
MRAGWTMAAALVVAGCAHDGTKLGSTHGAPPAVTATTQPLKPNGELHGTATLTQTATATRVQARVEGLAPGTYAIHLHSVGKCEGPKFASAGGHFNPLMKQHGRDNPAGAHLGDLPNIVVGDGGTGTVDYTVDGLQLTGG